MVKSSTESVIITPALRRGRGRAREIGGKGGDTEVPKQKPPLLRPVLLCLPSEGGGAKKKEGILGERGGEGLCAKKGNYRGCDDN